LFLGARTVFHGRDQNCRVLNEIIQNHSSHGENTRSFLAQINDMGVVQGELFRILNLNYKCT
jgi:hypothetical protein